MKKKLNLLGELIEDFDGVKSQKSLVKKLAEYMYRNFRSAAVELAWNIGPSTTVMNVTTDKDNTLYKSTGRDLNQSAFSEVLASGQALVSEVQEETDDSLFIEERIAIELYATQLVILPLYEKDDINGFISIYLLEEQDLAGLSELLQHMLTTITMMLKQIGFNEKLIGIARRSLTATEHYKQKLEEVTWESDNDKIAEIRQELLQDCRLAARNSTAVYIKGEIGTNKQEIAEVIHKFRTRDKAAFVKFDCAKLNDSKQAEVLFGSKANKKSKGYWDRAGKGTLYIVNIEEMTSESQSILEEISDNHSNNYPQILLSGEIEKAVNTNYFDADLADDITTLTVEVPALRDCREDLLNISKSYIKELSQKLSLPIPKMDRKFTQAILSSEWKGNHKELKKFLEKALISSPDKNLIIPAGYAEQGGMTIVQSADSLDDSIKRNIVDALKRTRGKVYGEDGAAVLLGLNPSTLQSKIRKFGIKKKSFKK